MDHGWYIPGKGKQWLEERFEQGTRQEGGGKRTWGRNGEDGFHWGDYSDEKGDIKDGRDVGDDGDGEHGGDMVDMVMKVILEMVGMFWPGSNGEEGGGEEVHPQELFRPASIRGWILFLNIFFHPPFYCDYVNYIQLKTNLVVSLMMMPATE